MSYNRYLVFRFAFTYLGQPKDNVQLKPIPPEAAANDIPRRPGIRAYNRVETLPGLQTLYMENLELNSTNSLTLKEIIQGQAFDPLLQWARAIIPQNQAASTPICLFASAGVRELNNGHSEALLQVIHLILAQSGFMYNADCVEVITGQEEGVFGWISLNHELGTFNSTHSALSAQKFSKEESVAPNSPNLGRPLGSSVYVHSTGAPESARTHVESKEPKNSNLSSKNEWIGAMDLGGSSLEITFPAHTVTEASSKLSILGNRYYVRSHTFEGLGLNKAFASSLTFLLDEKAPLSNPVVSPCLQEGFSKNRTVLSANTSSYEVLIKGKSNWEDCRSLANEILKSSVPCISTSCFPESLSASNHRLIGLNGFYVVWSFFNLTLGDPLTVLESRGEDFCSRNWQQVETEMKDVVLLETYCFRSAYILALADLLLELNSTSRLEVASQSVSWPLGAALVVMKDEPKKPKLNPIYLIKWIFCVFSFGFLACVCIRRFQFRSHRDPNSYPSTEMGTYPLNRIPVNGVHRGGKHKNEIKRRTASYHKLNYLKGAL